MKLAQKTEINEDVITVSLNVEELGDSVRDADTEKNQYSNFNCCRYFIDICYSCRKPFYLTAWKKPKGG